MVAVKNGRGFKRKAWGKDVDDDNMIIYDDDGDNDDVDYARFPTRAVRVDCLAPIYIYIVATV